MQPARKITPEDIQQELQRAEGNRTDNVVPIRPSLEEEKLKLKEKERQKELNALKGQRQWLEALLYTGDAISNSKTLQDVRSKLNRINDEIERLEKN